MNWETSGAQWTNLSTRPTLLEERIRNWSKMGYHREISRKLPAKKRLGASVQRSAVCQTLSPKEGTRMSESDYAVWCK
jgi:hypothetical protein